MTSEHPGRARTVDRESLAALPNPYDEGSESTSEAMLAIGFEKCRADILAALPPSPEPGLDVDALTAKLHADPALCGRYSPSGHPRWWLNPPCRQIAARLASKPEPLDVRDCECVPGHRCDCEDLRSLLRRILMNAEYPKMEAEGLAAAALGLVWSENEDHYVDRLATKPEPEGAG